MKEKISQGMTFQGFISTCGLILTIASLITLFVGGYLFLAIPCLIFGIILFVSVRGVLIDYKSMRIKPFLDIFIWKIGNWYSISKFDNLALKLFSESQTMNMLSISNTFTTRTFDVCLQGKSSNDILLKDFVEYNEAKSFLETYTIKLKLESIDLYALILEKRNT